MLPDPSKKCTRHSGVSRLTQTILDVLLHPLILLEVTMDETRRLFWTDTKLLRETERCLPINDSKVHRFCAFALRRRYRIDRHAQHRRGGPSMNVLVGRKCFRESLIVR